MKLAEMKCNVGFLDPQIFSATVVQFKSNDVIQAIKKAMNHDYVVGAFNTGSHWAYSEYIDPKMKKNQKTNLNSHTRQISR